MKCRSNFTCLLMILIFVSSTPSLAQRMWEPDNGIPVRQGNHIKYNRSAAVNDDGEICIVWSDSRLGRKHIFAQIITVDNQEVWGENGLLVAEGPGVCEYPDVIAAGIGNWIIVWVAHRDGVDFQEDGYVSADLFIQKLNSDGEPQWSNIIDPPIWGIPLCRAERMQSVARLVSDEAGGAIAVWTDYRGDSIDIYCQRINTNGEVPDGWSDIATPDRDGNLMVAGGENHQGHWGGGFDVCPDGEGGVIVGWDDNRDINNLNLYAQRISIDGDLMWDSVHPDSADAERGLPICLHEDAQREINICPDGNGGVFFAWVDLRVGFGDIYGQNVDSNGNILWTEDGELICEADATQKALKIVSSEIGEAIIVWEDQREDWFTSDLRIQKISGEEELVLHWGDEGEEADGIILSEAARNQMNPQMASDNNGGVIIAWQDERFFEFPWEDLYINRVNSEGEKIWDEGNGILVCNAELELYSIKGISFDEDNYALIWQDSRDESSALYGQLFDIESGETLLENNGQELITGLDFNAIGPMAILDGSNLWFGFVDSRMGNLGRHVYVQKVNFQTGEFLFESNGINITPGFPVNDFDTTYVQMDSATFASDGEGGLFATWFDNREENFFVIAAQKIDSSGNVLWGDRGSLVAPPEGLYRTRDQTRPRIIPDGEGGLFVAFHKYTNRYYDNILIQHIDSEGIPQWTNNDHNAIMVTNEISDHRIEGMITFEDGSILIVYNKIVAPGNYDILAQRIDEEGDLLWDEPVVIGATEWVMFRAKMEPVQDGILIAWEDDRNTPYNPDIYGQIISSDGDLLWDENGIELVPHSVRLGNIDISVHSDNDESFWIGWEDRINTNEAEVYVQRFDLDGEPLLEPEDGVRLANEPQKLTRPRLVAGEHEDIYAVWETADDWFSTDLMYTHLDSNGNIVDDSYPENGAILCDEYHDQISAHIISDNDGGFIAVWQDLRSTILEFKYNIYAQRVSDGWEGPDAVSGNDRRLPGEFSIEAAYPNPFNPETKIRFSLPREAMVKLTIYDVLGRKVTGLMNHEMKAGDHHVVWNGNDSKGIPVSSGKYFYRIESDGVQIEKSMILLR
ncbi:MAG: FlgD immunoglobulin-like domain containing protein [Candidatus Electryonea clarkiae]|nr:FlgD immunoglobulin-like domain containing protein [Candidatus Electryonea clarkiae]MDP8288146.1 FlgD immunoglobulin-like domain containing protein [Candidatus Electryonea clarkiae]